MLSAKISLPPELRVTNTSNTLRSKQSEVENSTPSRSSGVKTDFAHWTKFTALRCSIATPFGRPVDPEVYKTYARSEGVFSGAAFNDGSRVIAFRAASN